jgi:Tetracyclin repressor-like, C-terminal domain
MDPDVMADQELRRPVEHAFAAVRERLAAVIEEGRQNGELNLSVDPAAVATALVAVLQGGYVLARAADSADAYTQAVEGALALLAACSTSASR